MILFLLSKIGFDISCKLSPKGDNLHEIFENRFDISYKLSPKGDNLHEISNPIFSEKYDQYVHRMVKIKVLQYLVYTR